MLKFQIDDLSSSSSFLLHSIQQIQNSKTTVYWLPVCPSSPFQSFFLGDRLQSSSRGWTLLQTTIHYRYHCINSLQSVLFHSSSHQNGTCIFELDSYNYGEALFVELFMKAWKGYAESSESIQVMDWRKSCLVRSSLIWSVGPHRPKFCPVLSCPTRFTFQSIPLSLFLPCRTNKRFIFSTR